MNLREDFCITYTSLEYLYNFFRLPLKRDWKVKILSFYYLITTFNSYANGYLLSIGSRNLPHIIQPVGLSHYYNPRRCIFQQHGLWFRKNNIYEGCIHFTQASYGCQSSIYLFTTHSEDDYA